ncbi:response regulator [Paenibacillus sp. CN-4]|uniref:response regulator transcription factor n=1 Tax=Paenibacillus nanchangensis TaxID=3348343 RepID=UPI003978D39F
MWKVVIIDDDFQVVRGLRKAIPWDQLDAEFAGEAIDGEEGLRLIEQVNPDIVLTDIYMPVMNGIQMIEQLKNKGFAGRFVILSGYSDFEYARTALRLGVDDYLTKPVTVDEIRSVLTGTIEKLEETYLNRLQSGEQKGEPNLQDWLVSKLTGGTQEDEFPPPVSLLEGKYNVMVTEVLSSERIRSVSLADWNLFKFAVSNIVAEILTQEWPEASFVWLFGNHAAVVMRSEDRSDDARIFCDAERLGALIVSHAKQYLDLEVRYGLGGVRADWRGIQVSGDEAMQALLRQGKRADGDDGCSITDYVQQITQALKNEQDEEVLRLMRLYAGQRPGTPDDPLVCRVLAAELWTLLHNAMLMAGMGGVIEEEGLALRELSELDEMSKIEVWLGTHIRSVRKSGLPAIHEKHRAAVQFMIDYVHRHYSEDITLEQLASQLYISKNYLNQLFKKVTGETFTNYVIRVRIEKAKALLMEGSHLIYEVSEMVGYQNVPYFSTLFKKYCGCSPSELIKRPPVG